jgi:hypothetical protein
MASMQHMALILLPYHDDVWLAQPAWRMRMTNMPHAFRALLGQRVFDETATLSYLSDIDAATA